MPYINTKTNISISQEKELRLKERLGKAIETIPGKSETWLMLSFEDSCHMYFKGSSEKPIAFIEVKVFGLLSDEVSQNMTEVLMDIYQEELAIDKNCIYIKYETVKYWGWNGRNF